MWSQFINCWQKSCSRMVYKAAVYPALMTVKVKVKEILFPCLSEALSMKHYSNIGFQHYLWSVRFFFFLHSMETLIKLDMNKFIRKLFTGALLDYSSCVCVNLLKMRLTNMYCDTLFISIACADLVKSLF